MKSQGKGGVLCSISLSFFFLFLKFVSDLQKNSIRTSSLIKFLFAFLLGHEELVTTLASPRFGVVLQGEAPTRLDRHVYRAAWEAAPAPRPTRRRRRARAHKPPPPPSSRVTWWVPAVLLRNPWARVRHCSLSSFPFQGEDPCSLLINFFKRKINNVATWCHC